MRDTDVADGPAVAGDVDGGAHGLLGADGLDDRVRALAAGELTDGGLGGLPALGDDVGGPEELGDVRTGGVAAQRNDPLGAEALGGEDPAQADRAVADDGHGGALADAGAEGGVVAGAHHVGQGQQAGQQLVVGDGLGGQLHEGAVGVRDADGLALAAVEADRAPETAVHAGGVEALGAVVAGAVGPHEGGDDEVAGLQAGHGRAGLLDDAEELVADALAWLARGLAAVGPQVAAADTGTQDADDGILGALDRSVGHLLHADVVRGVDDGGAHGCAALRISWFSLV